MCPLPAKVTALKNLLLLMNTKRSKFAEHTLCNPDALRLIIPDDYWEAVKAEKISSFDQTVEILRYKILELFVININREDTKGAQACLLLWFSHLDSSRIKSSHKVSIRGAILTCTEAEIKQFVDEYIKGFVETCFYKDNPSKKKAFIDRVNSSEWLSKLAISPKPTQVGKRTTSVVSDSDRRTYNNYLNKMLEELAETIAGVFPDAFSDLPKPDEEHTSEKNTPKIDITQPYEAPWRTILEKYIDRIIAHSQALPEAFGYSPSIDCYVSRELQTKSLIGDVLTPAITDHVSTNTSSRMSGVLVGEAGSGRTAYLTKHLYSLALMYQAEKCNVLPFFIQAPAFLPYAEAQRTPHEFAAEQIIDSTGGQVFDLATDLKKRDADELIVWLIDDLDRLSIDDQIKILKYFVFSPNIILSALPWQTDVAIQSLCAPNLHRQTFGQYTIVDLSSETQKVVLRSFVKGNVKFDLTLGNLVLEENPTIACLPLGIASIYYCLRNHISNPAHIGMTFLREVFQRDKFNLDVTWVRSQKTEDSTNQALHSLLFFMLEGIENRSTIQNATDIKGCVTESTLGQGGDMLWRTLSLSRLFEILPDRQSARCTSKALLYLIAYLVYHSELTLELLGDSKMRKDVSELLDALWEWEIHFKSRRQPA